MQAAATSDPSPDAPSPKQEQIEPQSFSGFTTCSGRPVLTSTQAQQRAADLLAGSPEAPRAHGSPRAVSGFLAGQPSPPSSHHMQQAQTLHEEESLEPPPEPHSAPEASRPACNAQRRELSAAAVQEPCRQDGDAAAEELTQHGPLTEQAPEQAMSGPAAIAGFTTCTGRRVEPSAAAQHRAAALLQDADSLVHVQPQQAPNSGQAEPGGFAGFTTCARRRVEPSRAAQLRAAALLHEPAEPTAGREQASHLGQADLAGFAGLTTCTGRRVEPSKAAQLRAAALLHEAADAIDSHEQTPAPSRPAPEGFAGFTTCTGRRVEPSRAAQLRAASLLQDCREPADGLAAQQINTLSPAPALADFTPGGGQQVHPHAGALQKAAALLPELDGVRIPAAGSGAEERPESGTPLAQGKHGTGPGSVLGHRSAALAGASPVAGRALAEHNHKLGSSPGLSGESPTGARPDSCGCKLSR